jgi:hypothetical protein
MARRGSDLPDTGDGWSCGRRRSEEADYSGAESSHDLGTDGRWPEEHDE